MNEIPQKSARLKTAWCIFFTWLALMAVCFWWYQFRYISSMNDYWASFSGGAISNIKLAPKQGNALILHIIDPNCPCTRFSLSHIKNLEAQFEKNAEFININSISADTLREKLLNQLPIPASPAVAVWDKSGDLAYFGPYSSGRLCGEGFDFVAKTLSELKKNFNPQWINSEAIGCFCEWKNNA